MKRDGNHSCLTYTVRDFLDGLKANKRRRNGNGSLTVKGNPANKAPNAARDCAVQERRSTMPSPKVKAAPADTTTSLLFPASRSHVLNLCRQSIRRFIALCPRSCKWSKGHNQTRRTEGSSVHTRRRLLSCYERFLASAAASLASSSLIFVCIPPMMFW